jgi:hypothetical protein
VVLHLLAELGRDHPAAEARAQPVGRRRSRRAGWPGSRKTATSVLPETLEIVADRRGHQQLERRAVRGIRRVEDELGGGRGVVRRLEHGLALRLEQVRRDAEGDVQADHEDREAREARA